MGEKVTLFFCYAPADDVYRRALEMQLADLYHQGVIAIWHSRALLAGADLQKEINRSLNLAHIVLLLVSPDLLASQYLLETQVASIMDRHARGEVVVVPIVLRPCHWEEMPFGGLRPLPADGRPLDLWERKEETIFDIVEGLRQLIQVQQATLQKQEQQRLLRTRSIALFGYEMQGGLDSPLWRDPLVFVPDEAYNAWFSTKRELTKRELLNQTWIKTSNPEHTFVVQFFDGYFSEYAIADPRRHWEGSWELIEGRVRIRVSRYVLDVFANSDAQVYSGIEFEEGKVAPHAYFVLFPIMVDTPDTPVRHYDLHEVPELVEQAFARILRQKVDAQLLIAYGALLCRGEISVRSFVKILGFSRRYQESFVDLHQADETIALLYATFLGREVDAKSQKMYGEEMQRRGSNVVLADLVDGEEYQQRFGEDRLPPRGANGTFQQLWRRLKLP
jgi:hypothetical protein